MKNQKEILDKLGIAALNKMQREAQIAIGSSKEVIILSPTGSGKTLAFLLPIIDSLKDGIAGVQTLIITPTRELAIQIEQVIRDMGTGHKVNAVYGGRHISKDKIELSHHPTILVGTPGRICDHLQRNTIWTTNIHTLVLDEFDKSLEIGFENEMSEIMDYLPKLEKKIMTSATMGVDIPSFIGVSHPKYVNFLHDKIELLEIKSIVSPSKDKLDTLYKALCHLGNQPGIIFCNFKDAIQRVSDYLEEKGIEHGVFFGGMDQIDRERALIKFRNGSHNVLIATDLAARGLDISDLKYIIHYHLPLREEEFVHRNGRTARMHQDGTAYVLHWKDEILPDFIPNMLEELLAEASTPPKPEWTTLFISGGRKDKISKGDIAGLLFKQGQLKNDQLGQIELKSDCAFAAVNVRNIEPVIRYCDNVKLKSKKVRVKVV